MVRPPISSENNFIQNKTITNQKIAWDLIVKNNKWSQTIFLSYLN